MIFCSRIVFLWFHPCLVSVLFTGLSLLIVNFYSKFLTFSLPCNRNWCFHPLGVDAGDKSKSPSVKKRASREECAFFQTKKIKQEEGCIASEIMELKEKVAKLEVFMCEQQQEIWLLEQRLNAGLPSDVIVIVLAQVQFWKLTFKNMKLCSICATLTSSAPFSLYC